ncbi:hypothetical protein ACFLTE_08625 [Bacteroidota bacterium]
MVQQISSLNYIGYNSEDIKEKMRYQESDFFFNKEFETAKAKVLKYTDIIETKTLLYIIDKEDYCKYFMIMYDYAYYNNIVNDLNNNYASSGEDAWLEEINGDKFTKYIKKEEWYFTVVTKKVEN